MVGRVVVGETIAVRGRADAGAGASRVVPTCAAALEEDDDVVRVPRELHEELVRRAVRADRALGLEFDPAVVLGRHEAAVTLACVHLAGVGHACVGAAVHLAGVDFAAVGRATVHCARVDLTGVEIWIDLIFRAARHEEEEGRTEGKVSLHAGDHTR